MIVGFDMDGVILYFPGYNLVKRMGLDKILLTRLIRNRFFRQVFYYLIVRVNKNVKEILISLKEKGDRIVIISCNPSPNGFLEKYLRKNSIPFDGLHLWNRRCPELFFKMLAVQREKCDLYIDDRLLVVQFLHTHLQAKCKLVHFKSQRMPELKKIFYL